MSDVVAPNTSIKALIGSDDPLSEEAIRRIVEHAEEDLLVDFKESFNPDNEKCWIDIAIDAMAFANTLGGYLVFGVEDKTYKKLGLSDEVCAALCDIKVVNEKISRSIRPQFRNVRSKPCEIGGIKLVVLFIPPTLDRTHIVEDDLKITTSGAPPRVLVKKGTIYVRKSGSNQIMMSDDLEELLSRRANRIKEKILENVVKVVKADPEHEILVVAPGDGTGAERRFQVVDAPDATAVKGLSLVAAPNTPEGTVSLLEAAHKINSKDLPHREALMKIYAVRESLQLMPDQMAWLAQVSLIREVPAFYWLSKCDTKAKEIIKSAFQQANRIEKYRILRVAAFYGKGIYEGLRQSEHGKGVRDAKFPNRIEDAFKTGKIEDRGSFEKLQALSESLSKGTSEQELNEARKLDCGFHAPFPN
jgi:schlafen family protein